MPLRRTALLALTCLAALISWSAMVVFPASSRAGSSPGLLPPANPKNALGVLEYMWTGCSGATDYSNGCLQSTLAMLNAGRLSEGLGPVELPANWQGLTVAQQLFTLTELERTARGLPPDTGLAADWNAAAQAGADAGQDPTRGGSGARGFQAVWAGGEPNAIMVMADWVYADGLFPDGSSQNLGCSAASASGCWSHRDTVLHDSAAAACRSRCAMGAGFSANGFSGGAANRHESYAEIFSIGGADNPDPLDFTWSAERRQLPACERTGDSCSWAHSPVATASGIRNARGGVQPARPSFAVHFSSRIAGSGRIRVLIRTGVRLLGVQVVARLAGRHVRLHVWRRSRYVFVAGGRLAPGRWTLTVRYRRHVRGGRPVSKLQLTIPA